MRRPTDTASAAERDLVRAAQRDRHARARLVEAFRPLIARGARTYAVATGLDRRDLMQQGMLGLLRALERYDPSLGTPFWSYARWWVRQAMQQLVCEQMRPVVLSERAVRELVRIRKARSRLAQLNRREPTLGELAVGAELTREHVDRLIATERCPRALDEMIDGDDRAVGRYGEQLADPAAEEAYEGVTWRVQAEDVPRLLKMLSERERTVMRAIYGLGCRTQTLRELGETLGLSGERVRQIQQSALAKLRLAAGA